VLPTSDVLFPLNQHRVLLLGKGLADTHRIGGLKLLEPPPPTKKKSKNARRLKKPAPRLRKKPIIPPMALPPVGANIGVYVT